MKIPAGKHVIGDEGYKGEAGTISTRNRFDTLAVKNFKKRTKARHESFNSRIKDFKVLDERFRHGLRKHKACIESCCVIVQYDLDNGRALFDV